MVNCGATRITRQFHGARFRGDVALFNKHTLESDFQRIPRNDTSCFTKMFLHCQNAVAKKRSVALNILLAVRSAMLHEDVDKVAGDFNGTSWRKIRTRSTIDSTTKKRSKTQKSLCHLAPHQSDAPEKFQACGLTYVAVSGHPSLHQNVSYGNTGHVRSIAESWASLRKTRPATTRRGFTSATSAHHWLYVDAINVIVSETILGMLERSAGAGPHRVTHEGT